MCGDAAGWRSDGGLRLPEIGHGGLSAPAEWECDGDGLEDGWGSGWSGLVGGGIGRRMRCLTAGWREGGLRRLRELVLLLRMRESWLAWRWLRLIAGEAGRRLSENELRTGLAGNDGAANPN